MYVMVSTRMHTINWFTVEALKLFLATVTETKVWLGGTDDITEGSWQWTSGGGFTVDDWFTGNTYLNF